MQVVNHIVAHQSSFDEVIFDFSDIIRCYPDGIIPTICEADRLRSHGIKVRVLVPKNRRTRSLFQTSNWLHLIAPVDFNAYDVATEQHLSARRFSTFEEQAVVINTLVETLLKTVKLTRDVFSALEWAMNEIADNVINHSSSPNGGIIQVSNFKENGYINFVVADIGLGILTTLREGNPHIRYDAEAIGEAVKVGVTRNPEKGQGNGLAGTLRIAAFSGGSFAITSGSAQLEFHDDRPNKFHRHHSQTFDGTIVSAQIRVDKEFSLSDALGFHGSPHQPIDLIELNYEQDDNDAITLKLREETVGFGSRKAGMQIRTKCENLLDASPLKVMCIDWEGVPLVSSSFADEFLGKLFRDLGPMVFMSKIRNRGMEPLIHNLIDRAIAQRLTQAADEDASSEPRTKKRKKRGKRGGRKINKSP